MNYQLTTDGIRKVLRCVKNIMHEKSIFLFDITTEHNINSYFNNKTSFYKTRGMNIEWSNRYLREKKHIISTFITRFDDGRVFMEEHTQRIFSRYEIEQVLEEEGLEILEIYSDYTYNPPSDDTIMINFITKKRDNA